MENDESEAAPRSLDEIDLQIDSSSNEEPQIEIETTAADDDEDKNLRFEV